MSRDDTASSSSDTISGGGAGGGAHGADGLGNDAEDVGSEKDSGAYIQACDGDERELILDKLRIG